MLGFEMEVRSRLPRQRAADAAEEGEEDEGAFVGDQEQLMVFDVTMQVIEGERGRGKAGSSGKGGASFGGDWSFVPLSVKLKQVHGSTMTFSSSAVAALLGNDTSMAVPVGYESYDMGVAGQDEQ